MTGPVFLRNEAGAYAFLPIEARPFSAAVRVDRGFELVHATFPRPLPLARGLHAALDAVRAAGRPAPAMAGFELRIPAPFSGDGFESFNERYAGLLRALGVEVDGHLPAGRTNVVPIVDRVQEPSVHAFSYTTAGRATAPAFLISGIPETQGGSVSARLDSILDELEARLDDVGATWADVTAIQLYGDEEVGGAEVARILRRAGAHSVRWFPALPPIDTVTLEIDVRAAATEILVKPVPA
jgi:hypothetical protein